jgi:ABC-type branched-subunit amino acid transport system ATPase component/predicted MFS family arabinose efflux permease
VTADASQGVSTVRGGRIGRAMVQLTDGGPVPALLILFGLNMVAQMDSTGFGILVPNIRDAFHLSNAGILSLIAVAALVGLSLQVPIAQLADRRTRTRLMLVGAAIFSGFSVGTGLSFTLWVLVLMRCGSGIGAATVGPTHNSLLADWYPINARPRVYAFHYSALAFGAFFGPILAGTLASAFSWRAPFLVLAIPGVVLILCGLRLKEPSRGIQERIAMGVIDARETEEPPPSFSEGWRMTWKIESLRRIFCAVPFLAASLIGFSSLASILYQTEFHLTVSQRGWVAAAAEPLQLVGLVIGARVGSRLIERDPGLIIRFLAVVAAFCAGLLAIFATVPVLWVTIVANMAVTASLAAIGSGIYSSLSLAIPPRSRSLGFSMAAIWVIPGLIVLPIIGALSDSLGIHVGMLALVPVFLVGGLILSTAGRVLDRDIAQVRTVAAARAEVLDARRKGLVELLLVKDLCVAYGQVQVLFGVSLEIAEGEIVALLGTNGAGKSTLLKAICGIVEADKGAVILDGRDITHAPPNEIAALGVTEVPGGQGVFPSLTVAENLRVAGWLDRRTRHVAAERVREALAMFPALGTRLGDQAGNLSGGQQQMLALSMAFLARPRLLLVDELSLGLAPVIVGQLLPAIELIAAHGTTVILVEQSVNIALTIAQRAYFMEKGEIRFSGPTRELLDRPDVLRSVFVEGAAAQRVAGPLRGLSDGARELVAAAAPAPVDPRASSASLAAEAPTDTPVPLEVRDLSVRFGGIHAVRDLTLSVGAREILGVIGPNGAGKTTLFDLISGFTRSDRGAVLLNGTDVTRWRPSRRARAGLGRSFQSALLFPALTVAETVSVAHDRFVATRDPLRAALHTPAWWRSERRVAADAEALIELFSLGAYRDKFVNELSTGTRRVVDLACQVAHRPSVILLDEPSSGIAQRETEALAPLLLTLRDTFGASLVIIEHDMGLVTAVADRLVALDQGQILIEGDATTVLGDARVIEAYLGYREAVVGRSFADPPGGEQDAVT